MSATPQKYGTLLTAAGKQAIANAVATGKTVDLKYIALGDGGGSEYYPSETQDTLIHQVYQAEANSIYIDDLNPNRIYVEMVLPETVGGWTIREAAIKTAEDVVVAVGTSPSYYKPILLDGAAAAFVYRFVLEVSNASVVTLKIDPSVVYATVTYVQNAVSNHNREYNAHGGTYQKTPNRLMLRNVDGRCQVADPVDDADATPKKWVEEKIASGGVDASYEALPNKLALRSLNDARTQVGNPVEELDAVNLQTMRQYVANNSFGGSIKKPVITLPADDTVMQSLSFEVFGTELELLGGGLPSPLAVHVRVLNQDATAILSETTIPYPAVVEKQVPIMAIAPESHIGGDVVVIVRYEDSMEGYSPWSDGKPLKIGASLHLPVSVTSPVKYAMNVLPIGLTVAVSAGQWSDGSPYSGQQSSLEIYDAENDSLIYASGWSDYRTSFSIPNGTLTTARQYWARAQHKSAAAPAANPGAILLSPMVAKISPQAGRWNTIAPTAPNISALQHNIPGAAKQGTQKQVKIWGATSTDGGTVTYTLTNIAGGLSFSKYAGIAANEVVTMYVPTIGGSSQNASVEIRAVSSFGATSAAVTAQVGVIGQTEWVYITNGEWTAPADMEIDVWAGGGGGAGESARYQSDGYEKGAGGGGAGGGCGYARLKVRRGEKTIVAVGLGSGTTAPGGTSSFGGQVMGYGGESVVITGNSFHTVTSNNPVGGTGMGTIIYRGGNAGGCGGGGGGDARDGTVGSGATGGGEGGGGTTGEDGKYLNYWQAGAEGKKGVAGGGGTSSPGRKSPGGRGSVVIKAVL